MPPISLCLHCGAPLKAGVGSAVIAVASLPTAENWILLFVVWGLRLHDVGFVVMSKCFGSFGNFVFFPLVDQILIDPCVRYCISA